MFTTPWVRGFDMTAKDWALFSIDGIRDVVWNDDAFERLVLPSNSKELAWAFVENKALERDSFDDFVESKGRGLIILMFGPPGVGKTYTAEAVAERSRVPLYSMGAAVLGTNPRHVEYQLDRALQLCRLWKAMFLLDEADIFLSARNSKDLMRNELVAGKPANQRLFPSLRQHIPTYVPT
jgi:SpoVK/Ycf46/Vps4 family AAA+-type ATPase